MVFKTAFLVLHFVVFSYSANILAIVPTPSYSHQIAFVNIWRELSLRGHNVTLVTTDPIDDPKLINLTEIDLSWSYKFFANITKLTEDWNMWNMPKDFCKMAQPIIGEQLAYPPIQDLIHNRRHFDVILVEHFFPEYLGFAEIYQSPTILIASLDTFGHIHQLIGNPAHPVLNPEMGTPFYGSLSFRERLTSTLYSWYMTHFQFNTGYPERQKIKDRFFNTSGSLVKLISNVDFMILNVNPVIQGARAVGPNTINIGGFRPAATSSVSLPKDLKEFLDSATNGFIYFSLGSNVKSRDIGARSIKSIIETLSELPYKVLWKFEADTLPGKPSNVKLVKWAPQQQVLAHRNLKLFVTQGGLQSMEEGIYSEVPFVVIPYFGDQEQNANLMRSKGIAEMLRSRPFIKKADLKNAILKVIQSPSYKEAVQRLKRLTLDTPMTGLEKAVWWIEYVIRNKGAKHLRNPAADIPYYQYLLLDVIGFLVLVAILTASAIILLFKVSVRRINIIVSTSPIKLKEQ